MSAAKEAQQERIIARATDTVTLLRERIQETLYRLNNGPGEFEGEMGDTLDPDDLALRKEIDVAEAKMQGARWDDIVAISERNRRGKK